jgi:hypothetical protein
MKRIFIFAILFFLGVNISAQNSDLYDEPVQVTPVTPTNEQKSRLDNVFSDSNELLRRLNDTLLVISNQEDMIELQGFSEYPDMWMAFDWDNYSIVGGKIVLPSISDEILSQQLLEYSPSSYVYEIKVKKCTECWTALQQYYFWAIYAKKPDRENVSLTVRTVSSFIFAPTGAKWYYNCCSNGNIINSHFNYIVSEKDTVVEENPCCVLKQYHDNSTIASEKYILKQEEGKIYYYYRNQFNLLFDFDADINDTVEFTFMYRKDENKDTILSARYHVESITVNAQNLKTFATEILEEDKKDIIPWHYSYTEKIGFYSEFMPILDDTPRPAVDDFPMLRCYSDAGFSFVPDKWAETSLPCDYSAATGINIPGDENSIIYPNPFGNTVFVLSCKEGYLEITAVSGKVVCYSELSNGINKISTSHLLPGIYLVKIQNKDNSIRIFKMVKS